MVNKIVLEDTVVLYWDRDKDCIEGCKYCISYAKKIVYTKKAHYNDIKLEVDYDKFCCIF